MFRCDITIKYHCLVTLLQPEKGNITQTTYIYLFIYFEQTRPFKPLTVNTVGYKKSPGHAILLRPWRMRASMQPCSGGIGYLGGWAMQGPILWSGNSVSSIGKNWKTWLPLLFVEAFVTRENFPSARALL